MAVTGSRYKGCAILDISYVNNLYASYIAIQNLIENQIIF